MKPVYYRYCGRIYHIVGKGQMYVYDSNRQYKQKCRWGNIAYIRKVGLPMTESEAVLELL